MTLTIEQAADLVISGPGTVREKIIAGIEAYVGALPKTEPVAEWIVVQRQGFSATRKGPLVHTKHTEQMLRELYELHPDCICTVIAFEHTEWPEDGHEWLSIYGDHRRKKLPTPPATPDKVAVLVEALEGIANWLVCAPIASAKDMARSFPAMLALCEAALASVQGGK